MHVRALDTPHTSVVPEALYRTWMTHLRQLPTYALVTTGRTGSDFLQSLLDSHPEVLTFNGHFLAHTGFFRTSVCFNVERRSAVDLANEFVGTFIYKLVSRYDVQEGKDRLGETHQESFTIDGDAFRAHVAGLLEDVEITRRHFLLAVYGAYNVCLGHDLLRTRIVFHHPHLFYELEEFLKDCPEAGVVVTTRDPRANFVSHIENFRRYSKSHDNQQHLYTCLQMTLEDSTPLEDRRLRYVAVRLEDLPRESTLRALSAWLGITYSDVLLRSTWAGLDWHGDSLSRNVFESRGWSAARGENRWEESLGRVEKYVFNYVLQSRLQHYEYPYTPVHWWDALLVAAFIPIPMRYERRFLSVSYWRSMLEEGADGLALQLVLTAVYYFKRVRLCYRHYFRAVRGVRFNGPWLATPSQS